MDIILGNWIASRASSRLYAGMKLHSWEQRGMEIYYAIFTRLALLIVPVPVLVIMFLAVSKVGLDALFQ